MTNNFWSVVLEMKFLAQDRLSEWHMSKMFPSVSEDEVLISPCIVKSFFKLVHIITRSSILALTEESKKVRE